VAYISPRHFQQSAARVGMAGLTTTEIMGQLCTDMLLAIESVCDACPQGFLHNCGNLLQKESRVGFGAAF